MKKPERIQYDRSNGAKFFKYVDDLESYIKHAELHLSNKETQKRINLVLDMCDNNESNHDYTISTESVRIVLTDINMKA